MPITTDPLSLGTVTKSEFETHYEPALTALAIKFNYLPDKKHYNPEENTVTAYAKELVHPLLFVHVKGFVYQHITPRPLTMIPPPKPPQSARWKGMFDAYNFGAVTPDIISATPVDPQRLVHKLEALAELAQTGADFTIEATYTPEGLQDSIFGNPVPTTPQALLASMALQEPLFTQEQILDQLQHAEEGPLAMDTELNIVRPLEVHKENPDLGLRFNQGKLEWSLVDYKALVPMVQVLMHGRDKYTVRDETGKIIISGANNWKRGLKATKVIDSLMRHVVALSNGERNDLDSGLPHVGHLLCNAMFLSHMLEQRPDMDNLPNPVTAA